MGDGTNTDINITSMKPPTIYPPGNNLPSHCDYTDSVVHFRHLYSFRSMNVVSTSQGVLVSVVVGGREARSRPSLGEQSRELEVSRSSSEPYTDSFVGPNSSEGDLVGAVVLPYTLSSQSSTITSLVILGKRASSRMVNLSSRAGSAHSDGQPAFVLSRLEVVVSIMYFYNRVHVVIR